MNYCLCCSGVLLQHIRGHETYWFCRHCWQEMPVLGVSRTKLFSYPLSCKLPELATTQEKLEKLYSIA